MMRASTIARVLGLVLSALGGLWYWRLTPIVAGFAGTPMAASLDRTVKLALGLVCIGLFLYLTGVVMSILAKDDDA